VGGFRLPLLMERGCVKWGRMHPQEKGRENMQNKMMKKYFPVFVLPTLLAFTIGFIVPFIMGVYLSFCKFTTVTDAKFVGLQNYVKIFTEDGTFGHALWYTTAFTVVSVVLINVIGFAVALLLTKKIKGTNIFRTVFFMPNLIGGIILGYVWQLLLNGLLLQINKTLTYSSVYGFWGLVILMCWQQIGYMMIIYIAGIQNIPGELIEAAQIDGANKGQLLKHVIIPMVMPSITICTFLTLTNSFKLFDQNLALTNGEPSNMSEMLALNIFNTFYGRTGWEGVGQAKAVIFFILVGAIAMIQNRLTRSKEVQQ
jgi:raffinose/stachyose/melibiose transport system permease protein